MLKVVFVCVHLLPSSVHIQLPTTSSRYESVPYVCLIKPVVDYGLLKSVSPLKSLCFALHVIYN